MAWSFGRSIKEQTSPRHKIHPGTQSHDESHAEHPKHKPLPFLASPVDPEALKWAAKKARRKEGVLRESSSVAQFDAERTESSLAKRIFRKQHEASTLELFFDLFFVANLAIFTTRSAHVDLQSLSNYIGFFSILWTTWFHVSMYDVRFYVDSIFTRFCKFFTFGAMVSLISLGSLYDAILSGGRTRTFQGLALLMFAVRILWIVQYAIVLYFVRVFDRTLLPMCLTICVYLGVACGFLTTFIQDRQNVSVSANDGIKEVRIWYGIIGIEACAIIAISMFWRVLSFKHTHLVERLSLLSLIIMGEGIIGIVKSTSYTIQGTMVSIWEEVGIAAAAILLIYLIYALYFDNMDHEGFGTIGQQLWTLLHFPSHVAILLTVEGSTALIMWHTCNTGKKWIKNMLPNLQTPASRFKDHTEFLNSVADSYNATAARFRYKYLSDYYPYSNFTSDLAVLQKNNASFGTSEWSQAVTPILTKLSNYYSYFVYQNFGAEGPIYKLKKEDNIATKVELYDQGYRFVLIYYYISAGILLLLLASLIEVGKKWKTTANWWSIAIRVSAGLCLPICIVSPLVEKPGTDSGFRFVCSYLIIPIVTVGYLLVVVVDNVSKAIAEKHYTVVDERRISQMTTYESTLSSSKDKISTHEEIEVVEEEEDEPYELRMNASYIQRDIETGVPSHVQREDQASLIQHLETPTPTIRFPSMKAAHTGWTRLEDDER